MRPSRAVTVGVVALAFAFPACGDDDAPEAGSEPSPTSTSTTSTTTTRPLEPVDGADSAGDPYFPALGNSGYDVEHYDLALDVDPTGAGALSGVATIDAVATTDLASFHLDLVGLRSTRVTVDGEPATATQEGDELRITPAAPIALDSEFTTVVTYSGSPGPLDSGVELLPDVGWFDLPGDAGSYVLSEPSGGATWFPANDHPVDKATYTFHVTVPEGMEAAANGVLEDEQTRRGRTTWPWAMDDPMASYLATVVVGQLTFEDAGEAGGVTIRNVYADSIAEGASATFERQGEMLELLRRAVRPLPVRRLRLGGGRRPALRRPRDPDPVDLRARHPRLPAARPSRRRPRARPPVVRRRRDAGDVAGHLAERGLRHLRRVAVGRPRRRQLARLDGGGAPTSRSQGDEPVAPGDPGAEDLFHTSVY